MEITIKFDDKDIEKYNTEIVQILLQATNTKYPKQSKEESQAQQPQQPKSEQEVQQQAQEYTLIYIRALANEKAKSITNGKERVTEIIKKYGVKGLSSIKESDYNAFVQDLGALQ